MARNAYHETLKVIASRAKNTIENCAASLALLEGIDINDRVIFEHVAVLKDRQSEARALLNIIKSALEEE